MSHLLGFSGINQSTQKLFSKVSEILCLSAGDPIWIVSVGHDTAFGEVQRKVIFEPEVPCSSMFPCGLDGWAQAMNRNNTVLTLVLYFPSRTKEKKSTIARRTRLTLSQRLWDCARCWSGLCCHFLHRYEKGEVAGEIGWMQEWEARIVPSHSNMKSSGGRAILLWRQVKR